MQHQFILYHTLGCHLCEVAESLMQPYIDHLQLSLQHSDVADDDTLIEHYGRRIPVLRHSASGRELDWPFDEQQYRQFLALCLNGVNA